MSDYELRPENSRYDQLSRSGGSGTGVWLAIAAIAILVLLGVMFVGTGTGTDVSVPPNAVPGPSELPLGSAEPAPAR